MKNYELNEKNLALLGLLDKCHQLYRDIDAIYATEFEHTMWPQDTKTMPKIRRLLDVISDWIYVKALKSDQNIRLPVHVCKTCGRIFIGHETLKVFEGMHGKLLVKIVAEKNYGETYDYAFNDESELHQICGYGRTNPELCQRVYQEYRCLLP